MGQALNPTGFNLYSPTQAQKSQELLAPALLLQLGYELSHRAVAVQVAFVKEQRLETGFSLRRLKG
jgi:hypothetical protein